MVRDSFIGKDLYKTRNMRLAFKSGFYGGGVKAAIMSATKGALMGGRIDVPADVDEPREVTPPASHRRPNSHPTASVRSVSWMRYSARAMRPATTSHRI